MPIRAVLFDLDGTLLPMDQKSFMQLYFGGLAQKLSAYGYEPKALIDAIWSGCAEMVKNDGSRPNEEIFWEKFRSIFGERVNDDIPKFDAFYLKEFHAARTACMPTPLARKAVEKAKALGFRTVLATNPLFPEVATLTRTRWAGFDPAEFELITTYENSGFCKPNPTYYLDVAKRIGVAPEECLMIGNDVEEDMIAEAVGMKVFLMTKYVLNRSGTDISVYPSGDFPELLSYLETLA